VDPLHGADWVMGEGRPNAQTAIAPCSRSGLDCGGGWGDLLPDITLCNKNEKMGKAGTGLLVLAFC